MLTSVMADAPMWSPLRVSVPSRLPTAHWKVREREALIESGTDENRVLHVCAGERHREPRDRSNETDRLLRRGDGDRCEQAERDERSGELQHSSGAVERSSGFRRCDAPEPA